MMNPFQLNILLFPWCLLQCPRVTKKVIEFKVKCASAKKPYKKNFCRVGPSRNFFRNFWRAYFGRGPNERPGNSAIILQTLSKCCHWPTRRRFYLDSKWDRFCHFLQKTPSLFSCCRFLPVDSCELPENLGPYSFGIKYAKIIIYHLLEFQRTEKYRHWNMHSKRYVILKKLWREPPLGNFWVFRSC